MQKQDATPIDRRELDRTRFRIDTTVGLAHILTTVGLVVGIGQLLASRERLTWRNRRLPLAVVIS